jgi:hypothetical protein
MAAFETLMTAIMKLERDERIKAKGAVAFFTFYLDRRGRAG